MAQVFGVDTKMAEYVIGYSITDSAGVVESTHIYDEPVQSTFTSVGLDQFFMADGIPDSELSRSMDWTSVHTYPRFGITGAGTVGGRLAFMGYGSGSTAANKTDIALSAPLGVFNDSLVDIFNVAHNDYINVQWGNGDEWESYERWYQVYEQASNPDMTNTTGTYVNRELGDVKFQIAYLSPAFTSATTIRELGLFCRNSNSEMVLCARVILPEDVVVPANKRIRTLYRSCIRLPATTEAANTQFIDGADTTGTHRSSEYLPPTTDTYYKYPDEPGSGTPIQGDGFFADLNLKMFDCLAPDGHGYNLEYGTYSCFGSYVPMPDGTDSDLWESAITMFGTVHAYEPLFRFITQESSSSTVFRAFCCAWQDFTNSSGTCTATLKPYTPGSYYREVEYVFNPDWPDNNTVDIYAMRIRGTTYKFDVPIHKLNTQTLKFTYRYSISEL